MTLRSVLRLRDFTLRDDKGQVHESDTTLVLRMTSPLRTTLRLREFGTDVLTFHEVFSEEVYKNVIAHVKTCNSVIDLGANIGLASLYFAGHYPSCKVIAVEPNPTSYEFLRANLKTLEAAGRCSTLPVAVWGSERKLVAEGSNEPSHYNSFTARELHIHETCSSTIAGVPITRIIAESGFEKVDLLKVDIEGAEVELFKGDASWLEKVNSIAIEFHDNSRDKSGFDSLMRQYGFEIRHQGSHTVLAVREA